MFLDHWREITAKRNDTIQLILIFTKQSLKEIIPFNQTTPDKGYYSFKLCFYLVICNQTTPEVNNTIHPILVFSKTIVTKQPPKERKPMFIQFICFLKLLKPNNP